MTPVRWVLLPGLDGTGELFRWFLPYVIDERAVVVTYPSRPPWSLEDYVDHAFAALAPEQPCVVIAESFSGPIALRLAQRAASIVGLVLVASFVTCPNPLLKALPASLWAALHSFAMSETLLRLLCLGRNATIEQLGLLKKVARAIPLDVLGARLGLLRRLDETDSLASVRVPVLSVVAAQDRLVTAEVAACGQPAMQTAVIDGPHFLLQARPAECWRTIDAWWRALERAHPYD
jgi:pimeloyl-ACP methyl ester carboxylesterase